MLLPRRPAAAGYVGRVAAVQRLLFAARLQPLLAWLQRAVVEGRGRPAAAAAVCWELLQQGAAAVVVEVSALVIAQGFHATAAAVSRELHGLELRQQARMGQGGVTPVYLCQWPSAPADRSTCRCWGSACLPASRATVQRSYQQCIAPLSPFWRRACQEKMQPGSMQCRARWPLPTCRQPLRGKWRVSCEILLKKRAGSVFYKVQRSRHVLST